MTSYQRPVLSPEEQAMLHGHEQTVSTAHSVMDDLEAIGMDVSEYRALAHQTEAMRAGMLQRFTSTQYIAPKPVRRGK